MEKPYVLEGIITPVEWDDHDQVTNLSLFTANGEDVLLDCEPSVFQELKRHLKETIRVRGLLVELDHGDHLMKVKNFYPPAEHPHHHLVPDARFDEEFRLLSLEKEELRNIA